MAVIVLDPGHGGNANTVGSSANNAVGPTGTLEKNLTLTVATRLARYLRANGHTVHLTRTTDVNVSAEDRARLAHTTNAAVFLSIHFNAFRDATVQGTETLVRPLGAGAGVAAVDDLSRVLATDIQAGLVASLGHTDRGLLAGRWAVLSAAYHRPTTARCLAEVSFLTDPAEERRLASNAYLDQIACALCRALDHNLAARFGGLSLKTIPGYEDMNDNDAMIVRVVAEFNQECGYGPDDPRHLDPNLVKAWALTESGGHKDIYRQGDMMQINNPGDWVPEKTEIAGLTKGQALTPEESLKAALKWAHYKGSIHDKKGRGTFQDWKRAITRYNGGGDPDYWKKVSGIYNSGRQQTVESARGHAAGFDSVKADHDSPQVGVPHKLSASDEAEEDAYSIEEPIPDETVDPWAYGQAQAPQYPRASQFLPARAGHFRTPGKPRTVSRLVIHITDGTTLDSATSWFRSPNNAGRTSAHYVIGQDGTVVQMVRHEDIAHHASSANATSIGIEHVALSPAGAQYLSKRLGKRIRPLYPTDVQYRASADLVVWLCETLGIPLDRDHILGHSEAAKTDHQGCPNSVWDWYKYEGLLGLRQFGDYPAPPSERTYAGRGPARR